VILAEAITAPARTSSYHVATTITENEELV
jgi:hypothetical protein